MDIDWRYVVLLKAIADSRKLAALKGTMFGEVADDEPLLPPVPPAD